MRRTLDGLVLVAVVLAAAPLAAQSASSAGLQRVEQLVEADRYDEARRELTHWWQASGEAAGGDTRARGLYLRAVLAADVEEAERDLLRLAIEHAQSVYADRALFRLAQSRLAHRDTATAQAYLERLLLDHPSSGHRAEALALLGRREAAPATRPAPQNPPAAQSAPAAQDAPAAQSPTAARNPPAPARSPAPPATRAPAARAARAEFTVQLGSFARVAEAEALRDRLRSAGYNAFLARIGSGSTTVVRVGSYTDRASAEAMMRRLRAAGHSAAAVVSVGGS